MLANAARLGSLAAELVLNRLTARPAARLLLEPGTAPRAMFSALRAHALAGELPGAHATVLQLSELVGATTERDALRTELRGIALGALLTLDGTAADLEAEAERHAAAEQQVGHPPVVQVGQRVASGGTFGAWSEFFIAKAAGLIPVPDAIDDPTAAQLISMPFSALSLLDYLDVAEGDWIVQNTANGAVGRMVAQIAKARGIHVIGLVRRQSAVAELAEQGIENVVSTDADDWRDKALALADGARIVAGVDSVGGSASNDVLSLLSENGTLVIFGSMGAGKLELSARDIIFRQATVKGFWGSVVSKTMDADTRGALFAELSRYLADGTVTLPVAATFGLDDIVEAVTASDSPRVGKVLLRP